MKPEYKPPVFQESAFNCPSCNAFAHQRFGEVAGNMGGGWLRLGDFFCSKCEHCQNWALWLARAMIYPPVCTAPLPANDMPENVKQDYLEARTILNFSPRGAAALLRLAVQKLMPHLGESGKNINADIQSLVQKGLRADVQKSLDALRVIGNHAVHPGQIDITDDTATASALFGILNFIVEDRISQPKQISQLYDMIPDSLKEAIKTRDGA